MCNSWIEPFLFLFTIGVAILINLGTNIFMGSIAETTFSVTAILGQCFGEPTIEQICQTISIGAGSAIILILFVLPGVLACYDRLTAGKNRI